MTKIIVEGLVQGVGFRYFVFETALQLNLTGTVRNRKDGKVEIEIDFENKEDELRRKFIDKIKIGPMFAEVKKIDIIEVETSNQYTSFNIIG